MKKENAYNDNLREILEKTIDAQKGFNTAKENTDNVRLKNYFSARATEKQHFISELKDEMTKCGCDFNDVDGTFTGTIHRGWMDFKALLSINDAESMIEEAIRGEESALEEYNEILNKGILPISLRNVLLDQKVKIQSGINNLDILEDSI
ncbi:ferritin-like domain-containing protein [Kordia jejudonensis]|uniref:ferritin-like domain-containing protein n=1 Tax=Kordia jejudonensis TaxID=1348245 RepID=UPI000629745B|nr:PA2169 family four-helix-bundle protein [Kordia jejudonensis]